MAYIRVKIIKDRPYKYLVKGIRVGKKVQQKVIKYLGAVEPVIKKIKKQGRKPSIFVKELTTGEKAAISKASRNSNSFKKDRAIIILLSSQGKNVNDICKSLNKDRKTTVRAIKSFNDSGIKSLERKKAKGRPRKFTGEQRAKILQTVLTEPTKLGLHFTSWSLPRLKKYLIESGIVKHICIESIRNILKSEGCNYKSSRKRQYSNDQNFFKKNLQ